MGLVINERGEGEAVKKNDGHNIQVTMHDISGS
jgi:hypothetical protein